MTKHKGALVVAGLGGRFPGSEGMDGLAASLRRGRQCAGPSPSPPSLPPEDRLRAALTDCAREALGTGPHSERKLAVLNLGAETDLGRLCRDAGIEPGALVLAEAVPSFHRAHELAQTLLTLGDADAVLFLAGSLSAEPQAPAPFSIAIERAAQNPPASEGAAALLLELDDRVPTARTRIIAITAATEPGARGLEGAFQRALGASNWPVSSLGLLSVVGRRSTAIAESTAIARIFKAGPRETALTAFSAGVGDAGEALGLGAIVAAVSCLDRALLPSLCNWSAAGPALLRDAEGLFVPGDSRYWFTTPETPTRRAAVLVEDHSGLSLVTLEAGTAMTPVAATLNGDGAPLLFPIVGNDRGALEAGLRRLAADHASGTPLPMLARHALQTAQINARAPYALAIVAANAKELEREIGFMHRALEKAQGTGKAVRTPNGSVFTPAPLARTGAKVAFVYSGNGTAYPGLGRDVLLSHAKGVATVDARLGHRLRRLLRADLIYPRTMSRLSDADQLELTAKLTADPASLPLVGIAFCVAHSYILRATLGLEPDLAFGFSVGELAMRIALGQMNDWGALEEKLHAPCLTSGLAGEMTTVRAFWECRGVRPAGALWASHIVKASAADVRAAAMDFPDVFIMTINAPDETAISGLPESCAAMLSRLGAPSMPIDLNVAIHSPPAALEHKALLEVCDNVIEPVSRVDFYSAACEVPVPQTREAIAAATAHMLQSTNDFQRLVETTYAAGARIFIETGVRNNCANWIAAILGERAHVAVAMDVKGMASDVAWTRAVATLITHRLPLDFGALCDMETAPALGRLKELMEQAS